MSEVTVSAIVASALKNSVSRTWYLNKSAPV